MQARNVPRPYFTGREMADLIAFLHSIAISSLALPTDGEMLFSRRGCSNCHGAHAEGTAEASTLRGRGKTYTSVTLAVASGATDRKCISALSN
jgi:cytochrome c553